MFVPKAAVTSAASLRNPRRRQRTGSDDSVKPPSAKRQRSALRNEDTSASSENQVGQHGSDESSEFLTHSVADGHTTSVVDDFSIPREIPIRALQRPQKEINELDATIVLSKTDYYTVSQLPTLPDQLRNLQSTPSICFSGTSLGYALAMTNSHAIIWPYAIADSSPSPADIFTLSIPDTHKDPAETVPLGVLLSAATNGIPGLMIVKPHSGKVFYWETVTSAASLGLPRQKQTGTQTQINNLSYGEHVTDLINCEPSGILATFSTGRVAHITVRDPQGKPMVNVNFLRNSPNNSRAGSFLGGIKHVLGGSFWKKDFVAIRAGQSHQRGQRDVIIATSSGLIEMWDTHWNNGSILRKQYDIKNSLNHFFRVHDMETIEESNVQILDFALQPLKSNTTSFQGGNPEACQVLLILALPGSKSSSVSLIWLDLSEEAHVHSIASVDTGSVSTDTDNTKPKLLVPNGDTAFIMIGHSIILASLTQINPDSGSRLCIGADQKMRVPHDSLTFRSGKSYEILGSCAENQINEDSSACLFMVRDFGLIRISAFPHQVTESDIERAGISAKQRIEQAIFYGTMLGNPLNLNRRCDLDFSPDEIEQAALEICSEVLHSTSEFIPTTAISMDQNLRSRAKALNDLAFFLTELGSTVDRRTWWELLWGAEKLAAQRALWRLEENARRNKPSGLTLLSNVIGMMSDKFKTCGDKSGVDIDPVRSWLLYDTSRMEHIVPWIFNAVKPQKGHPTRQGRMMTEQIHEASQLSLAVLETAFRYRDEHASQYGIGDGYLEDGILITGYEGLPEFWTSKSISCVETGHLLDLELDSCRLWIQKANSTVEAPENQLISQIARNCSRQLQVLGQMHNERVRWLNAQETPKSLEESIATEQALVEQRKWQLFKLAGIGQLKDAIVMAEKFQDMGALVELIIELQDQTKNRNLEQTSQGGTSAAAALDSDSEDLGRKISLYFEKFGEPWADAFFSRQISMGQPGVLFAMTKFQPFVTAFLHKYPAYSRLGWINDVLGERNFDIAAESLKNLAVEHESDIWSHRAQLSFAKLAKLASCEENRSVNPALHHEIRCLDDLAEIDAVQEVIHAYITPILQGAIDHKAEVDLAIAHFGKSIAKNKPSLYEILREALTRIISRQVIGVERLVDFLTLADSASDTELDQNEFTGKEFYLALRAIRLSHYGQREPRYNAALQKLVWRRCMLKDNWVVTGQAVQEVDHEFEAFLYTTALFRTLELCLKDGQNENSNSTSLYVPTSPRDVSLTESDLDLLVSRFPLEQRTRISLDLERENVSLSQSVESGKLEFWFNHLVTSAENAGSAMHTASFTDQSKDRQGPVEQFPQSADSVGSKSRLNWL